MQVQKKGDKWKQSLSKASAIFCSMYSIFGVSEKDFFFLNQNVFKTPCL